MITKWTCPCVTCAKSNPTNIALCKYCHNGERVESREYQYVIGDLVRLVNEYIGTVININDEGIELEFNNRPNKFLPWDVL